MAKPYHHILIATDFSDDAGRAVQAGAAIAARFGARVTLAHVFDSTIYERVVAPVAPDDLHDSMAEAAREELERIATAQLTDLEGVDCVALAGRSAAHALVEHAEGYDVDLVVMGTHGRSGIRRMLAGSVAEKVVRHAPCDVLTLQHDKQPWPPRRILVGTDFSDASVSALERAGALATIFAIPVTLMHIFDESVPTPSRSGPMFETLDASMKRARSEVTECAREHFGDDAEAVVRSGTSAAKELCGAAKEQGAGLIVVGTHGRSGVEQMLIGSVAERVVRHAPYASLVVRNRRAPKVLEGAIAS